MQSRLPTAQNPHKNSLISSIPPNPLSRAAASSLEREKAMALKTPPLPTLTKSLHPLHPFPSHGDTTLLPHPPLLCTHHPYSLSLSTRTHHSSHSFVPPGCVARNTTLSNPEEHDETEVARGYTMTQFCDKMIDFFMTEKPQTKDWRKILVFRDDWSKYRENFFNRCQARADTEKDPTMKQKLVGLARKVKRIDDEIEKHMDLLKEVQESPLDINAIVARRRKDFTGEFFRHLTVISNTYDTLDDRDAIVRLGAKCLSAVRAYDCALEQLETSDAAQKKFDDILNSSSLDEACEKIKSLAKAKELDSSLVLLINGAWAAAKESTNMGNEVKEIMHSIYKATKKSLRSIAPPEIKLLKYLLNITDPEQRFSVLATAFSPGDEHEAKDVDALYTTPKELHKWIAIMLDAYHLNKEETDLTEARQMSDPIIIQRLNILKETIEDEYMKTNKQDEGSELKD